MNAAVLRRQWCAAVTNGCPSFLAWEEVVSLPHLDRDGPLSGYALRLLELNGWWLDHGEWVCSLHPPRPGDGVSR